MRTLGLSAACFILAAYPACAQGAGLADLLATNTNCSSAADARASLESALSQAPPDTTRDAIVSALRQMAARDDLCTELKSAAANFADQAIAEPEPAPVVADQTAADQAVADVLPKVAAPAPVSTSSSIVAATLAEAERRAANLKFEVGPPPRFMTKERISGRQMDARRGSSK